jgi:2-deoxy-D-gluconate 3-dehydrogenase
MIKTAGSYMARVLIMDSLKNLLTLSGRAAIVTGAAKGIGFGIAYRLAEAGASVLIADNDEQGAINAAKKLTEQGYKAISITTDVSVEDDIIQMVNTCEKEFGSVDILVNNAGVFPSVPVSSMSSEQFEKVMHINLRSVFLATKYAASAMKKKGNGGKIINITSIDALHPSMVGLAHYDASKHGVWGFTKNSAIEYAPDKIWINAIAPGGVSTPGVAAMQSSQKLPDGIDPAVMIETFLSRIPMHRMGEPDDIGKVALFLASDMASYITGEQIVVDGGALLN